MTVFGGASGAPISDEGGYVGIMVKATTPPTLTGVAFANTIAQAVVPILGGGSTTTLTNPASAPATAGAITVAATMPYAYLS